MFAGAASVLGEQWTVSDNCTHGFPGQLYVKEGVVLEDGTIRSIDRQYQTDQVFEIDLGRMNVWIEMCSLPPMKVIWIA
jgi:hypothetical protein